MKTIAQQLNVKEFPFEIKDSKGRTIYYENSERGWFKREYDSNGNITYFESSNGFWEKKEYDSNGNTIIYYENSSEVIVDKRPTCEGKTVEIDGVKYKLVKE